MEIPDEIKELLAKQQWGGPKMELVEMEAVKYERQPDGSTKAVLRLTQTHDPDGIVETREVLTDG